jgi:hypothetical protein
MTIYQLRDDIFSRGAIRHAFGLDGGGSTEMWARGIGVCNVPSDGSERPVVDAVVISAPPVAPATLAAAVAITNVSLSWTTSTGATSYNLKRSITNGGPYVTIASPTATTYTNTGLPPGTTFYYVVTAVNGAGESSNSVQAVASTQCTPPAAPPALTARLSAGQINLNWGLAAAASNYTVFRAIAPAGPYSALHANLLGTNYTDTTFASNSPNFYFVRGFSTCGASTDSTIVSAPLWVTSWAIIGNQSVLGGWGGVPGQTCYLLGSTNLSAPVAVWTRLGTNSFGASGSFSFTNAFNPAKPHQFFIIHAGGP